MYDIADLYKMETSVPAAFQTVSLGNHDLERRCRTFCRDEFQRTNILKRIVLDIHKLFDQKEEDFEAVDDYVADPAAPSCLWNPDGELSEGGVLYTDDNKEEGT